MLSKLPDYIIKIIETLESNNFEAYCVGGAVRDILIGIAPFDFDIATNAPTDAVMRLFERHIPTGIKHGTVTVIVDNNAVEITTYRIESEYTDSRHPDKIHYASTITEDLSRRDFTINAIALNKSIVDPFNGQADINLKTIRAVGNPNTRMCEDALRILRAFRFSSQLDFEIEKNTLESCVSNARLLNKISRERIYSELKKMLTGKKPHIISTLINNNILSFLGLYPSHIPKTIDSLDNILPLRLAVLCYYCAIHSETLLKNLHADTKTINKTSVFEHFLYNAPPESPVEFKKVFYCLCEDEWHSLLNARRLLFNEDNFFLDYYTTKIISEKQPYKISMLNISGNDLKKIGFKGRQLGKELERILDFCCRFPNKNEKEQLEKLAVDDFKQSLY